jgi:hypothetical protein
MATIILVVCRSFFSVLRELPHTHMHPSRYLLSSTLSQDLLAIILSFLPSKRNQYINSKREIRGLRKSSWKKKMMMKRKCTTGRKRKKRSSKRFSE